MAQATVTLEHSISAVTILIEGFLHEFNYFTQQTFSISTYPTLMKAISLAVFKQPNRLTHLKKNRNKLT